MGAIITHERSYARLLLAEIWYKRDKYQSDQSGSLGHRENISGAVLFLFAL